MDGGLGSHKLAVVGGFVAVEQVQDAGVTGEGAEGQGGSDDGREVGGGVPIEIVFARTVEAGHFQLDGCFLNSPDTHLAPAGYCHRFDVIHFCGVAGLNLIREGFEELLEAILGFAAEDDATAEDSVADGILRDGGFAFGGDGAFGFGSVGAGGLGFA
jgi:hypothetical protein